MTTPNDGNGEAVALHQLVRRLRSHIAGMAPHQKERVAGQLLIEATEEIERLHAAIMHTLDENKHLADGENCTLIRLKCAVFPHVSRQRHLPVETDDTNTHQHSSG